MTQVLSDIKSVGGVVGCFLYDQKGGLGPAVAPTIFKPAKLAEVGRTLAKTIKAGGLALPDGADLMLHFEEILVLAREIRKGTLLVVLCEPGMNPNILTMSLNLAEDELRDLAETHSTNGQAAPAVPAGQAPAPAPGAGKLDDAQARALEAALAKIVGPMATFIFKDCLNDWEKTGGSPATLLTLIQKEIGDASKEERFAQLAAAVFPGQGL